MTMSLHPKYRPDIDGLRAIAVLSVVIFHAFPDAMRGGFVGVDVFFVISGFLISKIIIENLEKGEFCFLDFYYRRICRIFPALILMLGSTYAAGWFFLMPQEFAMLGKHVAAGAAFVANFIFWGEAGYFDGAAYTKPLLHLWSLGIEEQFYIVWPVALWFAWKRRYGVLYVIIVGGLASFLLNMKWASEESAAAFFSPQTRFWELLSGGFLAWVSVYQKKLWAEIGQRIGLWLSSFGLFLLIYGFWRIHEGLSFPGAWAIVPVAGAMMIIAAGSHAWPNKIMLSHKYVVWLGLISFPLYLWHWPLLVFARIFEGGVPSLEVRWAALLCAVVLAWLTFQFIEKKFRDGLHRRFKAWVLVVLMALISAIGWFAYEGNGLPDRAYAEKYSGYSESIVGTERAAECFDIPYAYGKERGWHCSLGDPLKKPEIFVYGDSHALSMLPAFQNYAKSRGVNVLFAGTSGCPSVLGVQSMRGAESIEKYDCQALNRRIYEYVVDNEIGVVVLVNRWVYYLNSFSRPNEFNPIARDPASSTIGKVSSENDLEWAIRHTVEKYGEQGVKVFLVADVPQQKHDPREILRAGMAQDALYMEYSVSSNEHYENQRKINSILSGSGAEYLNFDGVLCSGSVCPLVRDGRFLYMDDDHLSLSGAELIYPSLSQELDQVR